MIRKFGFLLLSTLFCDIGNTQKLKPYDLVNPNIGGISPMLETTIPLVNLPNSMMRTYRFPGNYLSEKIKYFPFLLCGHRMGTVGSIMPVAGVHSRNSSDWASNYDHDFEQCKPGYYSVWLEDFNIDLQLAVAQKSAIYKFLWNNSRAKYIMMALTAAGKVCITDKNTIEGYEIYNNKVKVYFHIKTSIAFTSDSIWKGDLMPAVKGTGQQEGENIGLSIGFDSNFKQPIFLKIGVSYISQEQARKNLNSDIEEWDFDSVVANARETWNKALSKIEIEGGTLNQQTAFYTALYRNYERMVCISENGQYYSGYDNRIHSDEGLLFWVDDWMWDTYLASHPLMAMIQPEQENLKIQSYIRMYQQGGWMPSFPVLWGDHVCMNGHHSAAIIAGAYFKGLRNFDINIAYEALRKNAMHATMLPWRNGSMCSLDTFYLEKGYYPALNPGENETVSMVHGFEKRQSVALTLGHSFDDWCLAQLAKELGKTDDYHYFLKRSENYKCLFNSEIGFFTPRTDDGNWVKDFNPKLSGGSGARDYFTENNAWTYLWQVQHDVPSLIKLLGGNENLIKKLDKLFIEDLGHWKPIYMSQFPDATGQVGQFVMGNEPSLHIPYLYNYVGQPWKTQKRIRMLLDTWFSNSPFGIPGDEDGGGLSAFVVFSSMGFYPFNPGLPIFNITSPIFTKVTVHLENNKAFTISSPVSSNTNKYIQSAKLNGKNWSKPWFSWSDIKNGGNLELELGNRPNYSWGILPENAPPTALD